VTIKQTVYSNVCAYQLVGSNNVTFEINKVTGRGWWASLRINATLDSSAVIVCGRPMDQPNP
jgi:hypothetical protein